MSFTSTRLIHHINLKNLSHRVQQSTLLKKSCIPQIYESRASYQKWFQSNMTASNPLIDGPDYTFLDGRRTPLRPGQKRRAIMQKEQVERSFQFMKEIDFAVERYNKKIQGQLEEKKQIMEGKFKKKNTLLDNN